MFLLKDMDQDSAHMVAASKVPMLKPGEYETLEDEKLNNISNMMRQKHCGKFYRDGATLSHKHKLYEELTEMPITTAEEKAQRRLEFWKAVEKRFGWNAATRKTQRNLLKQQYENFTAPSSEMLDQTFDRLQKLVSQLELLDEKLLQEDVNQKLLRSLSPDEHTCCCGEK
ncbi:hypothetical protein Tco_0011222 [Tanacetum coccineum]